MTTEQSQLELSIGPPQTPSHPLTFMEEERTLPIGNIDDPRVTRDGFRLHLWLRRRWADFK